MDAATITALALVCAPAVHPSTVQALATVESGLNPHAIGVVGGALGRQPMNLVQALATVAQLQAQGWSYSVGLAQIHVSNLAKLGLSAEQAFDPCTNLRAMQTVLLDCFARAGQRAPSPRASQQDPQWDLRRALSCYYSGDFSTGFQHGYVRRVARAMPGAPP